MLRRLVFEFPQGQSDRHALSAQSGPTLVETDGESL